MDARSSTAADAYAKGKTTRGQQAQLVWTTTLCISGNHHCNSRLFMSRDSSIEHIRDRIQSQVTYVPTLWVTRDVNKNKFAIVAA
jgi:hypothetical protein